jgi:DNA ligase-1
VLLVEVAVTSAEVGAVSARTAKIARIADVLAAAAADGDPALVAV